MEKGRIIAPSGLRNYIAVSPKLPSDCGSAAGNSAATVDECSNTFVELISRSTLSSLRQYTDFIDLLDDYSSTIGSNAGSILYLSPIYYTKPLMLTFLRHHWTPAAISNRIFFDATIYSNVFGSSATSFSLTTTVGQVSPCHPAIHTRGKQSATTTNLSSSSKLNLLEGINLTPNEIPSVTSLSNGVPIAASGNNSQLLLDNALNLHRKRLVASLGTGGGNNSYSNIDCDSNSNTWENDSVGGKGSHHSLRSLSMALYRDRVGLNGSNSTPTASVMNEEPSKRISNLMTHQSWGKGSEGEDHYSQVDGHAQVYYPMLCNLQWGGTSVNQLLKLLNESLLVKGITTHLDLSSSSDIVIHLLLHSKSTA